MTTPAALTLGGRPLHEELARDVDRIVASVVDSVADLVPAYGTLPKEQVLHEFALVVAATTRAFIEVVRTGAMPPPETLEPMAAAAGRRAEEGMPLSAVLAAYHLGCSRVFDDIMPRATAEDQQSLHQVYKLLLAFLAQLMDAASRGYLAAQAETFREAHGAKQALLDAVLDGGDARAVAERVGLRLPAAYGVLSLRIGAHADELDPEVDATVATRRKLRRLRHELDIALPDALASLTATGATVLVAAADPHSAADPDRLVRDLARAAGAPILAAFEPTPTGEVPEAVALTEELLAVASGIGWTEGVVRLRDVAVAYQLTRPSAATARLAELLEPLDGHPDLMATLEAFATARLNRRRAAKALNVHLNTVNYRLNRVRDIVGLDVGDPLELQTLLAALAARRAGGSGYGQSL